MRTKLNITEGIFPMPVLMVATYNEDGSVNVMNAAWGTMQERKCYRIGINSRDGRMREEKIPFLFTQCDLPFIKNSEVLRNDGSKKYQMRNPLSKWGKHLCGIPHSAGNL